jgi:DNA-binding SARP family transcriptional activator/truncated hemoglobin YjbI
MAEECFNMALRMARDWPSLRARLEFLYGSRLAAEGLRERAARRYAAAITTMEGIGAKGWASLFEVALERLDVPPTTRPDLAVLTGGADRFEVASSYAPSGAAETERLFAHERIDPNAAWEISMLGSFVVRSGDSTIAMPASLSATALKIVALRRRILVEELVEELWPESAPGVGMRRLRNVLWRIRVACGEILLREDKFVLLSPEVVTDVEVFRRLAAQALDPSAPSDKAAELARSALSLYGGELLPADRYADWAAAARESLSRLHVQMIELRVRHAIEDERVHEALGLLEVLMETDPYEEDHYLRAAELHASTGNRRRALATLGRAERTLSEFGIPPSAGMKRLTQQLS